MTKINQFSKYLSLIKFSHTIFAMPFAFIGYFLAIKLTGNQFSWLLLLFVVLCMVFARSAAMGFNRYIDRQIDARNERTAKREIPAGAIKPQSALWFVILNCVFFIVTTFFINRLVFYLSPVALIVVLGYSFTKRFTWLCHFVLGVGLSLSPIGAYLAVTGKFAVLPVIFSFVVLLWVSGFDIIYALQDDEFDKSNNLKSVPVFLGRRNALILSTVLHFISVLLVFYAGFLPEKTFGMWYWVGAAFFTLFLTYQHFIIKPNDLSKVNLAFFTANGIASVVFSFFTVLSLLIG